MQKRKKSKQKQIVKVVKLKINLGGKNYLI